MEKGKKKGKDLIFFEVEVSHPCWFVDVTERNPDAVLRTFHTAGIQGDYITNLVELRSPAPEKDLEYIRKHELVKKVEVLMKKPKEYVLKVTSSYKAMTFKILHESGVTLLESPITDKGTDKELLVAGSYKDLKELIGKWKEKGWGVKLTRKKHVKPGEASVSMFSTSGFFDLQSAKELLTDKQRETFEKACDHGYYEVPKKTSIKELAEKLGISPPTVAEHLRKAEAKLFPMFLKVLRKL